MTTTNQPEDPADAAQLPIDSDGNPGDLLTPEAIQVDVMAVLARVSGLMADR